jgi:hypothetical protein
LTDFLDLEPFVGDGVILYRSIEVGGVDADDVAFDLIAAHGLAWHGWDWVGSAEGGLRCCVSVPVSSELSLVEQGLHLDAAVRAAWDRIRIAFPAATLRLGERWDESA